MLGSLRSPVQPLHGDAHLNNVLNGPTARCGTTGRTRASARSGGTRRACWPTRHGRERAEAAYAASGMRLDPGELKLWIEARSLQVAVWRAFLATS